MMNSLRNIHNSLCTKIINSVLIICFTSTSIIPPEAAAQNIFSMPVPGVMVKPTTAFHPAIVKGITFDPQKPFDFQFLIDQGDDTFSEEAFRDESIKLMKYFLAALTVPEEDLWVNLSPYEEDRIVPAAFGQTEMGRDLLAQDYLLKQLTASLMYPEEELGQKFWQRVYQKAHEEFGTTNVPINTFNKVWVVPETAKIYERENSAFVTDTYLKVMLEEDYLALANYKEGQGSGVKPQGSISEVPSTITSQMVKEILIPEIEREVNEGQHFAQLRQIYNSLILASWYKERIQHSLLHQVYADQNKVDGVDIKDKNVKDKIYAQYLQAFKKGVYDYIKEDYDPYSQQMIPRKYFSGGFEMAVDEVMTFDGQVDEVKANGAMTVVSAKFTTTDGQEFDWAMGKETEEEGTDNVYELMGIDPDQIIELPLNVVLKNQKTGGNIRLENQSGPQGTLGDKTQYFVYSIHADGGSVGSMTIIFSPYSVTIPNIGITNPENGVGGPIIQWLAQMAQNNGRSEFGVETDSVSLLRAFQNVLTDVQIDGVHLTYDDIRKDPRFVGKSRLSNTVTITGRPQPIADAAMMQPTLVEDWEQIELILDRWHQTEPFLNKISDPNQEFRKDQEGKIYYLGTPEQPIALLTFYEDREESTGQKHFYIETIEVGKNPPRKGLGRQLIIEFVKEFGGEGDIHASLIGGYPQWRAHIRALGFESRNKYSTEFTRRQAPFSESVYQARYARFIEISEGADVKGSGVDAAMMNFIQGAHKRIMEDMIDVLEKNDPDELVVLEDKLLSMLSRENQEMFIHNREKKREYFRINADPSEEQLRRFSVMMLWSVILVLEMTHQKSNIVFDQDLQASLERLLEAYNSDVDQITEELTLARWLIIPFSMFWENENVGRRVLSALPQLPLALRLEIVMQLMMNVGGHLQDTFSTHSPSQVSYDLDLIEYLLEEAFEHIPEQEDFDTQGLYNPKDLKRSIVRLLVGMTAWFYPSAVESNIHREAQAKEKGPHIRHVDRIQMGVIKEKIQNFGAERILEWVEDIYDEDQGVEYPFFWADNFALFHDRWPNGITIRQIMFDPTHPDYQKFMRYMILGGLEKVGKEYRQVMLKQKKDQTVEWLSSLEEEAIEDAAMGAQENFHFEEIEYQGRMIPVYYVNTFKHEIVKDDSGEIQSIYKITTNGKQEVRFAWIYDDQDNKTGLLVGSKSNIILGVGNHYLGNGKASFQISGWIDDIVRKGPRTDGYILAGEKLGANGGKPISIRIGSGDWIGKPVRIRYDQGWPILYELEGEKYPILVARSENGKVLVSVNKFTRELLQKALSFENMDTREEGSTVINLKGGHDYLPNIPAWTSLGIDQGHVLVAEHFKEPQFQVFDSGVRNNSRNIIALQLRLDPHIELDHQSTMYVVVRDIKTYKIISSGIKSISLNKIDGQNVIITGKKIDQDRGRFRLGNKYIGGFGSEFRGSPVEILKLSIAYGNHKKDYILVDVLKDDQTTAYIFDAETYQRVTDQQTIERVRSQLQESGNAWYLDLETKKKRVALYQKLIQRNPGLRLFSSRLEDLEQIEFYQDFKRVLQGKENPSFLNRTIFDQDYSFEIQGFSFDISDSPQTFIQVVIRRQDQVVGYMVFGVNQDGEREYIVSTNARKMKKYQLYDQIRNIFIKYAQQGSIRPTPIKHAHKLYRFLAPYLYQQFYQENKGWLYAFTQVIETIEALMDIHVEPEVIRNVLKENGVRSGLMAESYHVYQAWLDAGFDVPSMFDEYVREETNIPDRILKNIREEIRDKIDDANVEVQGKVFDQVQVGHYVRTILEGFNRMEPSRKNKQGHRVDALMQRTYKDIQNIIWLSDDGERLDDRFSDIYNLKERRIITDQEFQILMALLNDVPIEETLEEYNLTDRQYLQRIERVRRILQDAGYEEYVKQKRKKADDADQAMINDEERKKLDIMLYELVLRERHRVVQTSDTLREELESKLRKSLPEKRMISGPSLQVTDLHELRQLIPFSELSTQINFEINQPNQISVSILGDSLNLNLPLQIIQDQPRAVFLKHSYSPRLLNKDFLFEREVIEKDEFEQSAIDARFSRMLFREFIFPWLAQRGFDTLQAHAIHGEKSEAFFNDLGAEWMDENNITIDLTPYRDIGPQIRLNDWRKFSKLTYGQIRERMQVWRNVSVLENEDEFDPDALEGLDLEVWQDKETIRLEGEDLWEEGEDGAWVYQTLLEERRLQKRFLQEEENPVGNDAAMDTSALVQQKFYFYNISNISNIRTDVIAEPIQMYKVLDEWYAGDSPRYFRRGQRELEMREHSGGQLVVLKNADEQIIGMTYTYEGVHLFDEEIGREPAILLDAVEIDQEHRSQGLGQYLFAGVIESHWQRIHQERWPVVVKPTEDEPKVTTFYESMGFQREVIMHADVWEADEFSKNFYLSLSAPSAIRFYERLLGEVPMAADAAQVFVQQQGQAKLTDNQGVLNAFDQAMNTGVQGGELGEQSKHGLKINKDFIRDFFHESGNALLTARGWAVNLMEVNDHNLVLQEINELAESIPSFNSYILETIKTKQEREDVFVAFLNYLIHGLMGIRNKLEEITDREKDDEHYHHYVTILKSIEDTLDIANNALNPGLYFNSLSLFKIISYVSRPFNEGHGEHPLVTVEGDANVIGDSLKLKQVVRNLIKNAVESLPQGERKDGLIRISRKHFVHITIEQKNDHEVTIRFEDNGDGIDPEQQDKIFQRGVTTKERGSGLGLDISRQIIEKHGGTLKLIKSKRDEGSVFEITLPVEPVDQAMGAIESRLDLDSIIILEDGSGAFLNLESKQERLLNVLGLPGDEGYPFTEHYRESQEKITEEVLSRVQREVGSVDWGRSEINLEPVESGLIDYVRSLSDRFFIVHGHINGYKISGDAILNVNGDNGVVVIVENVGGVFIVRQVLFEPFSPDLTEDYMHYISAHHVFEGIKYQSILDKAQDFINRFSIEQNSQDTNNLSTILRRLYFPIHVYQSVISSEGVSLFTFDRTSAMVRQSTKDLEGKLILKKKVLLTGMTEESLSKIINMENDQAMTYRDPHLDHDDAYGRALKAIMDNNFVSEAAHDRRKILTSVGPHIQNIARNRFREFEMLIYMIPFGSTLMGYSSPWSDLEFHVGILKGVDQLSYELGTRDKQNLERNIMDFYTSASFYINTYIFHQGISSFIDDVSIQLGTFPNWTHLGERGYGENERDNILKSMVYLFMPALYGDPQSLEEDRRRAIAHIAQQDNAEALWQSIQEDYMEYFTGTGRYRDTFQRRFDMKSHFRDWMTQQGLKMDSLDIVAFQNMWEERIGLPDFEIMKKIYNVEDSFMNRLMGGGFDILSEEEGKEPGKDIQNVGIRLNFEMDSAMTTAATRVSLSELDFERARENPWEEMIRFSDHKNDGPLMINQQRYQANQEDVRKAFLELVQDLYNGKLNEFKHFKERMLQINRIGLIGKNEDSYYASISSGIVVHPDGFISDEDKERLRQLAGTYRTNSQSSILFQKIKLFKAFKDVFDSRNLRIQERVERIGEFYLNTFIDSPSSQSYYIYRQGNNSMHMNMVNAMLRLFGLNGIPHDTIDQDFLSSRERYVNKSGVRQRFMEMVAARNPQLDFDAAMIGMSDSNPDFTDEQLAQLKDLGYVRVSFPFGDKRKNVIKAYDQHHDRWVVLKKELAVLEVVDIYQQWNQPDQGVVAFYGAHEFSEQEGFFVFEYVEGQDIASYLQQKGPQKLSTALEWTTQLIDAMQAFNQAGYELNDTQVQNIILSSSGRIRIIDYILDNFDVKNQERYEMHDVGLFLYEALTADQGDNSFNEYYYSKEILKQKLLWHSPHLKHLGALLDTLVEIISHAINTSGTVDNLGDVKEKEAYDSLGKIRQDIVRLQNKTSQLTSEYERIVVPNPERWIPITFSEFYYLIFEYDHDVLPTVRLHLDDGEIVEVSHYDYDFTQEGIQIMRNENKQMVRANTIQWIDAPQDLVGRAHKRYQPQSTMDNGVLDQKLLAALREAQNITPQKRNAITRNLTETFPEREEDQQLSLQVSSAEELLAVLPFIEVPERIDVTLNEAQYLEIGGYGPHTLFLNLTIEDEDPMVVKLRSGEQDITDQLLLERMDISMDQVNEKQKQSRLGDVWLRHFVFPWLAKRGFQKVRILQHSDKDYFGKSFSVVSVGHRLKEIDLSSFAVDPAMGSLGKVMTVDARQEVDLDAFVGRAAEHLQRHAQAAREGHLRFYFDAPLNSSYGDMDRFVKDEREEDVYWLHMHADPTQGKAKDFFETYIFKVRLVGGQLVFEDLMFEKNPGYIPSNLIQAARSISDEDIQIILTQAQEFVATEKSSLVTDFQENKQDIKRKLLVFKNSDGIEVIFHMHVYYDDSLYREEDTGPYYLLVGHDREKYRLRFDVARVSGKRNKDILTRFGLSQYMAGENPVNIEFVELIAIDLNQITEDQFITDILSIIKAVVDENGIIIKEGYQELEINLRNVWGIMKQDVQMTHPRIRVYAYDKPEDGVQIDFRLQNDIVSFHLPNEIIAGMLVDEARAIARPEMQRKEYEDFYGRNRRSGMRALSVISNEYDKRLLGEVVERISDVVPLDKNILSIGAGQGHLEIELMRRGFKNLKAIDISPANTRAAQAKGIDQDVGDAYQLDYPNESFDVVLFHESIGGVSLDVPLKEANRVLRSNGQIIVIFYDHRLGSREETLKQSKFLYYTPLEVQRGLRYANFQGMQIENISLEQNRAHSLNSKGDIHFHFLTARKKNSDDAMEDRDAAMGDIQKLYYIGAGFDHVTPARLVNHQLTNVRAVHLIDPINQTIRTLSGEQTDERGSLMKSVPKVDGTKIDIVFDRRHLSEMSTERDDAPKVFLVKLVGEGSSVTSFASFHASLIEAMNPGDYVLFNSAFLREDILNDPRSGLVVVDSPSGLESAVIHSKAWTLAMSFSSYAMEPESHRLPTLESEMLPYVEEGWIMYQKQTDHDTRMIQDRLWEDTFEHISHINFISIGREDDQAPARERDRFEGGSIVSDDLLTVYSDMERNVADDAAMGFSITTVQEEFRLSSGAKLITDLTQDQYEKAADRVNEYSVSLLMGRSQLNDSLGWRITKTSLDELDRLFDLKSRVLALDAKRVDSSVPLVIMEWGPGHAVALRELNEFMQHEGIENYQLIGFADQYYAEWEFAPKEITFILDAKEKLAKHLANLLQDQRINLIFSHRGLRNIFLEDSYDEAKEHIHSLQPFLNLGAEIISDSYGSFQDWQDLRFDYQDGVGYPVLRNSEADDEARLEIHRTKSDAAMGGSEDVGGTRPNNEVGGIDLTPARMNIEIERDHEGMPLPFTPQQLEQMNIPGLVPVIMNIQPVHNLPLFLGQGDEEENPAPEKSDLVAREIDYIRIDEFDVGAQFIAS